MDGVFWHNDVGYVVDIHGLPSAFPQALNFGPIVLDDMVQAAPGLPDIGTAPVASWLIARLLHLTRERVGFETTAKLYNDGGGYCLNFIAFTRDMKPIAFFYVQGTSQHCRCWGQCAPSQDPRDVVSSFVQALVADPTQLMECHLIVVDTDPPNLTQRRFGKPYELGWNGVSFLGVRHAPTTPPT